MTKTEINAVLGRVSGWPEERQRELAEVALEIEAEIARRPYRPSKAELAGIDEGLTGEAATDAEVEKAFAKFRRK